MNGSQFVCWEIRVTKEIGGGEGGEDGGDGEDGRAGEDGGVVEMERMIGSG